jgi:DNA gyrase/topoisomerase IV subunit A
LEISDFLPSSVAMHRIEEELSELISKTETIIENKENSMHLVEDQTTTIKKDFQDSFYDY